MIEPPEGWNDLVLMTHACRTGIILGEQNTAESAHHALCLNRSCKCHCHTELVRHPGSWKRPRP